MKSRRHRAIAKAEYYMERYEEWKEHVVVTGGALQKDKSGKLHGFLYGN